MLYEEARVYLDGVSKYGSVLGLECIRDLLNELGNPQDKLEFVHIAGTNGKGSILAYISTILKNAGYKTGRYISPTVMDYLERLQINGEYISETQFAEVAEQVKTAADKMIAEGKPSPTVFEIETAMAMVYFAGQNCDIVVLETGLGGFTDATNIVKNVKACVFASISIDHLGMIGNNLTEIAQTKAGIIKDGAKVITGPQTEEVLHVLRTVAEEKECEFIISSLHEMQVDENSIDGQSFSYKEYRNMRVSLLGANQLENVSVALETISALNGFGMSISEEAVRTGLRETTWPGRFQVLKKEPLFIVDGAHNIDAIRRLVENIQIYLKNKKIIAIIGIFKDKEYQKMISLIAPFLQKAYVIELPNTQRTLGKDVLKAELEKYGVETEAADGIIDAVKKTEKTVDEETAVLGFGSLSYLGEVIRFVSGKEDIK